MLRSLKIENYVLIDELALDFKSGFSVFTGETGAGKSILIDAIGIICGDKFTTDLIRFDQDKAYLEAVFETKDIRNLELLKDNGIDLSEDPLIISRELTKDGRGSARINGKTVTVSLLKALGENLVDIHSQHDTQYLLNTKHHLSLLDAFQNEPLLLEVKEAYKDYKKVVDDLNDKLSHDLNPDELEYLQFQVKEIDDAQLELGEDEILEEKQKAMMAFEKNNTHLTSALSALDEGNNVSVRLHEAMRHLNALENLESSVTLADQLSNFYHEYNELFLGIQSLQDEIYFDEYEINQIQERLFLISKLKKKFGHNIEEILKSKDELLERIELIENRFEVIQRLETEKKRLYEIFHVKAVELSLHRKSSAIELEKAVLNHLRDLYLEKAQFKIDFVEFEGNQSGIDQVEFLISMNPGEQLKPLIKVASGGELSRIALAIKTVIADTELFPDTMIFDEIDTGIGGRTAQIVAECIDDVATDKQVLCITHLPQIACMADKHIYISKAKKGIETITNIKTLSLGERINEIARMASGSDVTTASLDNAREMIDNALLHKKRNTEDQSNHV